jgi:two-component system, NarL family, response regulator DevR
MRAWKQELENTMRVVSDVEPLVRALLVGPPTQIGGVASLIGAMNGDYELLGPVWPASAAIAHVAQHSPDVVLVHHDPTTADTRDLIRGLRARFPAMKVVVLGSSDVPEDVRDTVKLGVSAYLPLSCSPGALSAAFNALRGDHVVLGEEAARTLFSTEVSRTPLRRIEVQVLRLLAEGLTYDEITAQLEISRSTLKRYLNHIESKLNARNRVQAVANATRQGLL